ncbi:hypothetical protein Zmor_017729 [Zophobas morio]|uniref:Secreted protein n=1 Tax=Zophobas morio TaxID=2755281 RepID=A0AA38IAA1_9CUCU|nr:hypothetical protein Zmor_017729 [Zophobas morio]
MHKLIHLLMLGAVHESFHETAAPSARPRQTSHVRLHSGRIQEAEMKPFEQLVFPNTSIGSSDTSWARHLLALPRSVVTEQLKLN